MNDDFEEIKKRMSQAHEDDLPKELERIFMEARDELLIKRDHRNLSLLMSYCLSCFPEILPQIRSLAEQCIRIANEERNIAMSAIYSLIAGKTCGYWEKDGRDIFYANAMHNPKALASISMNDYDYLFSKGADSAIFDNSLLGFIGVETGSYDALYRYYCKTDNRTAACYSIIRAIESEYNDSREICRKEHALSKLYRVITAFDDLPEVCEAVRFICEEDLMPKDGGDDLEANNRYAEKKYRLATRYVAKFAGYKHIEELEYIVRVLEESFFRTSDMDKIVVPGKTIKLTVNHRNIDSLTVSAYRTDLTGKDTDYDGPGETEDEYFWKHAESSPIESRTYTYDNSRKYEEKQSEIEIDGLPLGIYIIELKSNQDNSRIHILHVTNIAAMVEELPDKRTRIIVVDSTTGHPVPDAMVEVMGRDSNYNGRILNCNADGELIYRYVNEMKKPHYIFPYTEEDKFCDKEYISSWRGYIYNEEEDEERIEIVTDRAIYRPGQTVHAALICYSIDRKKNVDTCRRTVEISLMSRRAWGKAIDKATVTTDGMGVARYDFLIPEDIDTGGYVIHCSGSSRHSFWENLRNTRNKNISCQKEILIEEYKRPTFEVKFDEYDKPYKAGDVITVEGVATSYAGVPIADSKVRFKVKRARAWWWYTMSRYWSLDVVRGRYGEDEFSSGVAVTDHQGRFSIEVPLSLSDGREDALDEPLFINIIAEAEVIDSTGEVQSARTTFGISNRPYLIYARITEKIELSADKTFCLAAVNASGKDIEKDIEYWFDDTEPSVARSNTTLMLPALELGRHTLHFRYDGTEETNDFYIFDKEAAETPFETEKWSYQSSAVFPEDGSDVILQIGCSEADICIFYNVFSGGKLLDSGYEMTRSGMINRHVRYRKEYGGSVHISYAWIRNRKMQSQNFVITKPFPDRRLQFTWKTFRDRVVPGTSEKWILSVKDSKGRNVSANVIATLYDKSLDSLAQNRFMLVGPRLSWNSPYAEWEASLNSTMQFDYKEPINRPDCAYLFNRFKYDFVEKEMFHDFYGGGHICCCKASNISRFDDEDSGCCPEPASSLEPEAPEPPKPEIRMRSDMSETAFFMPKLRTDRNGDVQMEFLLPDSLTTWKFKVVAHTDDMHFGNFEDEAVARKVVMVKPNMPRFVRVGDDTAIAAKVTNASDKAISGRVNIELMDAETEKVVFTDSKELNLSADESKAFTFRFCPDEEVRSYICKVYAYGDNFSDGEQHTLSVLPDKAEVTVTHVISQDGAGREAVDTAAMLPDGSTRRQLSLQYTSSPVWLAIKALPAMTDYVSDNAISVSISLYCNLLTDWLQKSVSRFGDIKTANMDSLQKTTARLVNKLRSVQGGNGGFRWFKNMPESAYITTEVLMHLSRLQARTGVRKELAGIMDRAFSFCNSEMCQEVDRLKKREEEEKDVSFPRFTLLQHMYSCAITGRDLSSGEKDAFDYLVQLMLKDIHVQTMREKAMSAVILEYSGDHERALKYAESLRQYTNCDDNGCRTFETYRASYSWYSYKIPTHVAGMEAIHLLYPEDTATIWEMQKWLLEEKRTQMWETGIDSVNSVHALLLDADSFLADRQPSEFYADDRKLEIESSGNEGYVETELPADTRSLSISKKSAGISWGAVFAQFLQPMSDVEASGSGMSIRREIISDGKELHVGDRIRVRLTYECERNFDLVTIIDSRAACMEPVQQLSWNDSLVHVQPLDKETRYSYYGISKGRFSIETDYYLDRPGVYETGIATIVCTYAPEFRATCPSEKLVVLQ